MVQCSPTFMALYCNGKALIINGTMYCNGKVLIIICSPTKARATVKYFFPACASIHITSFFRHLCHPQNKLNSPTRIPWSSQGGEKQTRLWQLESLWGGVISHPGGSRLNQLLIKLAPWQCWGNVAHCQGNSRRLHGNQAARGSYGKVQTHSKLTRKEKSTESLKIQQGHEHCVHFIGIM